MNIARKGQQCALAKIKSTFVTLVLVGLLVAGASFASAEEIIFVDWSWDSAQVHNRIAGFIIENGYGYDADYIYADTHPGLLGMRRGEIHISMEMWIDNYRDIWDDATAKGEILDLGPNFPNAPQGWYVPTYMIEGDPERGIEPVAPDLKSVEDLPKYWELFQDQEDPTKGRFYNAPTGWEVYSINKDKLTGYGLDDTYTAFVPGSQAALDVSISTAYRRGQPWVGYYWEPSAIMGMYDMTMLEEPEYSDECWETDFACGFPNVSVRVGVSSKLPEIAPELVPFLENYITTLEETNDIVKYFEEDANRDFDQTSKWFLEEYEDMWTDWVPEDVAEKVKSAIQ